MERLFNFVYEFRAFFTFLVLEILCFWMIVENNQFQSTKFYNSSNKISAGILGFSHGVREYLSLRTINEELAGDNARLRKKLERKTERLNTPANLLITDSASVNQFDFVSAKVVNNSTAQSRNYITIDRGSDQRLEAGMAVISASGAVGKVKLVSRHYAVLISLLNTDEQVSAVIKRTGYFGTIQWDGTDPRMIDLRYVPRHVKPLVGDTIVTSGFNAIFPKGIPIGIIKNVTLKEEGSLFLDIKVELAQDFSNLNFVEVVRSNLKPERDSLELKTTGGLK
jgi:rod shape-determining protein MreC